MKYIIETADNGYILTTPPESEEDRAEVRVFEEYENEKKAFEALVYQLAEDFGFMYDKWKKDNLNIKWNKKGHKYEDNFAIEKEPSV
jgi:hypothetical protein